MTFYVFYGTMGIGKSQEMYGKCYIIQRFVPYGGFIMNGHEKQKEQSRKMIEKALFLLMQEKEYTQITISEIVQRADVARRTFYRLYTGKEDVLQNYFQKLCQEYQTSYEVLEKYDISRVAAEFFSFWYQYKEVLLLLHKSGLENFLYTVISNTSGEVIKNRIEDSMRKNMSDLGYFMDYSVGGFIKLLQRWIENGMEESPKYYAQKVSDALLKFIQPVSVQKTDIE